MDNCSIFIQRIKATSSTDQWWVICHTKHHGYKQSYCSCKSNGKLSNAAPHLKQNNLGMSTYVITDTWTFTVSADKRPLPRLDTLQPTSPGWRSGLCWLLWKQTENVEQLQFHQRFPDLRRLENWSIGNIHTTGVQSAITEKKKSDIYVSKFFTSLLFWPLKI